MNNMMQQQDDGRETAARRSRSSGVGHTGANANSIPTVIEVNQQNFNNNSLDDQNSNYNNATSRSETMQQHINPDHLRRDGHAYPNSPPSYYVQYPPPPTVAQPQQQQDEDDQQQNDQHNGQPRAWYNTTENIYRPPLQLQEGESEEEGEEEMVESDILNSDVTSESSGDESYSRRRRRYAGFLFFGICLVISVMIGKFYM